LNRKAPAHEGAFCCLLVLLSQNRQKKIDLSGGQVLETCGAGVIGSAIGLDPAEAGAATLLLQPPTRRWSYGDACAWWSRRLVFCPPGPLLSKTAVSEMAPSQSPNDRYRGPRAFRADLVQV